MKRYLGFIASALLTLASGALAQSGVQLEPGVARASLVHGDVNMQRGDSGDWVAVTLNTPFVAGDRVSTGDRSRAEVQLDFANVLRLDQNSTAKIADLTRTHMQVQMSQGLANYDVMKGNEADAEIDTPNVAVHPLKEGRYRILVNSDSETQVIVRKGAAEVTTPQGSTRVESGDMITVQGTDNPQYQTASAPGKDDWDNFNNDRDRTINDAESWRRTNHYYTGSQDLDAYGRWEEIPDYGSVWVPAGGPDWAPYRDGRWVWEPYYGWTWVSYEPWGWAPYHYGRWFLYGSSWCWWPGPVYGGYRPLWAPAYVSFFGFGGHFGFGVGFGFGSIGWLPIGPGDGFYPWYGRRGNVVNVVNVTNITNITNITNVRNVNGAPVGPLFRGRGISNLRLAENNPRLLRGVSTMPTENFGKGAVPAHSAPINAATFRNGGMLTGQVPAVPTHESLRPVDRAANVPANAGRLENQHFFGKNAPVATTRSFSEQQARMQTLVNASTPSRGAEQPGTASAEARGSVSNHGSLGSERSQVSVEAAGGTKNNATSRSNVGPERSTQSDTGANRAGWHRFGESNPAQAGSGSASRDAGAGVRSTGSTRSDVSPHAPSRASSQDATPARDSSGSPARGTGWHTFSRSGNSGASGDSRGARESASPRSTNSRSDSGKTDHSGSTRDEPYHNETPHGSAPNQASSSDSGGWRSFPRSPEPSTSADRGGYQAGPSARGASSPSYEPRGSYGGYSRSESRGSYGRSESSGGYSRPPLDLRQPIVTPRSSGSYGSASRGGYHSESSHSSGSSSHSSSSPHSGSSSHSHSR